MDLFKMDLIEEFKQEFVNTYSEQEYKEIENCIDYLLEHNESYYDKVGEWKVSCEIEKRKQLQYSLYINLQKGEDEINIEYENGINNGTVLRAYSMDGSGGVPLSRMVRILDSVKIIKLPDFLEILADNSVYEAELLDIYKKRSYDEYVSGGIHKEYRQDYINDLKKMGFDWKLIYRDVEVDVNLV